MSPLILIESILLHSNSLKNQVTESYLSLYITLVAQLVGAFSCMPKRCRFDSQLHAGNPKHIPRLWVQCPVKARTGGNQSMFLSHFIVSPPL